MPTISENLQTLIGIKAGLKEALDNQGKAPTDALGTYAGLIDGLENPDQIEYCVTVDGENKVYMQVYGEEKVTLTATPNDVREGTSVISNEGYMVGEKFIPSYHTSQGFRVIPAESEFTISKLPKEELYDYTKLQAMTMPFNTTLADSVAVDKVVIDDSVYNAGSTEAVSNVTKDDENKSILLGIINGSSPAIIRYFTFKEVP